MCFLGLLGKEIGVEEASIILSVSEKNTTVKIDFPNSNEI